MPAPRSADQRDYMDIDLQPPMLDSFMVGDDLRREVVAIAQEIRNRWVAAIEKDTGNLAGTAAVTARKSTVHRDKRWLGEFSAGGPRAPYAVEVEDRDHTLENVLASMGYSLGQTAPDVQVRPAPIRKPAAPDPAPAPDADSVVNRLNARQAARLEAAGFRNAEHEGYANDAAELLRGRVGSKNSELKYQFAVLGTRYGEAEDTVELRAAVEEYEAGRLAKGLEPRNFGQLGKSDGD